MTEDTLLEMWNRGDTEKESCVDQERESQARKKLSHSIEEILRRPTCVRKDKIAQRNWSVIKENTRISNQLSGIFLFCFLKFSHGELLQHSYENSPVNAGMLSLPVETPQIRRLEESPKATTDCMRK